MQNSSATSTSSASLKGYGFLVFYLVLLSALGSFVNDMFSPALPAMRRFFDCSVPTVQMGLTAGMCGLGLGQIILGPVSDKYGRKPVLVASISVFVVAAVVSIFSPTIHFFIWCRFFQGLGVSGGYFLARTIPADRFQGRQLAKVMALVGAINGFAPASAPVLGGIVADTWGWRGIFVCLAVFAVIVLAMAPGMKESLPPGAPYGRQPLALVRRIPRFAEKPSVYDSFMLQGRIARNAVRLYFRVAVHPAGALRLFADNVWRDCRRQFYLCRRRLDAGA